MKFSLPVRSVDQKVVVSAVFVAAMFMNIMDGTVVNVALPTLSRYFAVPIGSVSGVVTAYLVTLAVAMPASGWIGDRFGGGKFKMNLHHRLHFVNTKNFKPAGEPRWATAPALDLDG